MRVIGSIFGHVLRYCSIMGTLISSDENFIIFSYNSLTGTLLRAKKCIILISFSTYNQVALFFSRFVGPSIFQMHL